MSESKIWREGGWVYKKQHAFMAANELWCLRQMAASGYVPKAEMVDGETLRTSDLGTSDPVTDREAFVRHLPLVLSALQQAGIRHGDLTEYAVIVKDNKPYLIDFSESRLACDPRPDKRPEGDEFWLRQTMELLCNKS